MKKEEKTRILYLASGARDARRRRLQQREASKIAKLLRAGTDRDSFTLITELEVQACELQELLLRHRPHIVHLSGRGTKEGGVVLTHGPGRSLVVDGRALAELFRILKDNISVVFFNVCHVRRLARALKEVADYTVLLRGNIDGENAVTLSAYFYQALSFGRTPVEAFELAKNQLRIEGEPDYKKAVLHVGGAAGARGSLPWHRGAKTPPAAGTA